LAWYYVRVSIIYLLVYFSLGREGFKPGNQGIVCIYKDLCIRVRTRTVQRRFPLLPSKRSCAKREREREREGKVNNNSFSLPALLTYLSYCPVFALPYYLICFVDGSPLLTPTARSPPF